MRILSRTVLSLAVAALLSPAVFGERTESRFTEPERSVPHVRVVSNGKVVFSGTMNLGPTLDRIARGEKDPHRNDGSVFGNRERLLPERKKNWYREYVVPTPGEKGPGPQRINFGRDGEAFYTPDHSRTFIPLNERKR
ncbi:MAG TPA: ribonuclease domain-containing protein [Thermoanaerobaculia bacterium]|nr:ribonuclease domain-containing protein [Thermoanaerobaculia bacterium]